MWTDRERRGGHGTGRAWERVSFIPQIALPQLRPDLVREKDSNVETPETRYSRSADGVHIAYQVLGDADLDLVVSPGFVSHLEHSWEDPSMARSFDGSLRSPA
jgi:hypothetical protein